MIVPTEAVMDTAKLANDIGTLRYETEYRFESGAPCYQTLREGDIRGILVALRDRGFTISRQERAQDQAHVEAPPLCATEDGERLTVA
jgi:hypothetical protein